jgi:hypothetical protein
VPPAKKLFKRPAKKKLLKGENLLLNNSKILFRYFWKNSTKWLHKLQQ